MNITVYTKSACPNCTAVKSLLRQRNLGFVEISLDNPIERETFFVAHPQDAADAARYRWLRAVVYKYSEENDGDALDAAIDAAM